jgi:hypothetical protein
MRHPYAYGLNAPLRYADPSGEFVIEIVVAKVVGRALISAGVGAAAGAVSGGIAYVIANPGRSFRDYVRDEAFQRAVLSGAAGGAVSGLVGGTLGALGRLATFWGAAGGGAASGFFGAGAGKVTYNLLTPCSDWRAGVLEAMAWGSVAGGATAGLWHGVTQWLRGLPATDAARREGPGAMTARQPLKRPGRLGGPEHQAKAAEVAADIRSRGLRVGAEFIVKTPGGLKSQRAVDVVALHPAKLRLKPTRPSTTEAVE